MMEKEKTVGVTVLIAVGEKKLWLVICHRGSQITLITVAATVVILAVLAMAEG